MGIEVAMLLIPLALAAPPSIDTPLRTGASSPGDAALAIGIERYPLLGRDVPYAEADARAMADTFVYTRGIPLGRVLTLTGSATREDIVAGARELGAQVHAGGTLFVYFAGHGAASGKSRTLLGADVKATTDSFAARGVPTAELNSMGSSGGGRVVMLVDACFGGASRDGSELLPGTRWAVPVDPDAGQWAATVENQVAGPLSEAGHGLFTYLAVGAMRGWADGELSGRRDGVVTADEAQAWMVSALRTMGRTGQTPKLAPDLGGFTLTSGVKEAVDGAVLASMSVGGAGRAAPPAAGSDYAAKLAALAKAQSEAEEAKRAHDARVALSSFLMARTEVSQALWTKVMGQNPSTPEYSGVSLLGDRLPVQNVSWCEVVDFANRLSKQQGLAEVYSGVAECASTAGVSVTVRSGATGWRLPTESEWEYAARAGTAGAWGAVTEASGVCGIGNVGDATAKRSWSNWAAHPCADGRDGPARVGSFQPNGWGLYDVTGNVWEWTWDGYDTYAGGSTTNPTGPSSASGRVNRGGSWSVGPANTRLGYRNGSPPGNRRFHLGARLARSLP